ncbi:MAG: efflux RND transporter periplasmic adaptor subunit [bacterium]
MTQRHDCPRLLRGALLTASLAMPLTRCTHAASADADSAKVPEVHATIERVQAGNFTQTITATGTVLAAPGSSAALSAPSAARVSRVYVAEGDRVKIGDPLVAFDPITFDAAVTRATAALTVARHAQARAERLTTAGVAPRKELDQAEAALADAEAGLAMARREKSLTVLRAPLAGVVSAVRVIRDQSVDPTQPVVELVDPRALEVVFGIPPRTAALVATGSLVQLYSGVDAESQTMGTARVVAVGSTVDAGSRTVTVRTRLSGTTGSLRVGESVAGRIAGTTTAGVITIPSEALIPEGETFHVFVVDAKSLAHSRPVKVLAQTEKVAQISQGLAAGERIVTHGAFGVDEGVKIIEPKP